MCRLVHRAIFRTADPPTDDEFVDEVAINAGTFSGAVPADPSPNSALKVDEEQSA